MAQGTPHPPAKSLVLDANVIFDLQTAGILLLLFGLQEYSFFTVDLVEKELRTVDSKLLRGAGLMIISLSGSQVAEVYRLRAEYQRGPSFHDIAAFVYAKDNNIDLATRDSGLWQVATDQGVRVWETSELIKLMVAAGDLTPQEAADALSKALARLPVKRLDWQDLIRDWRKR